MHHIINNMMRDIKITAKAVIFVFMGKYKQEVSVLNKSVWSEIELREFPSLDGNIKTDVLIIGGGMAGILCAHKLHNKGIDYILVEGRKVGGGVTENTTGKITFLHSLIYSSLNKEDGAKYLYANKKALEEYESMCKGLSCDFEKKDGYTYSLRDRKIIEREVMALNDLGVEASFCEKIEAPLEIKGAVKVSNQAQFNPLKFIKAICENLNIFENTFVEKINGNVAKTKNGDIEFEKVIIATHFPFINIRGSYFLKLYQHRSYVCAFENIPKIEGMYVDENNKGLSFRQYKNLSFVGGGGHRTGKNSNGWNEITDFVKKCYPDAKLKYMWATQDCMSLDSVPYIGKYSKSTPNRFVATGFNKWGMTGAMVAKDILCDMVLGKENEYKDLFSPQRSMLSLQLLINTMESAGHLIMPKTRRCTHMGCALNWNKFEHTWDCACHGSRYSNEGTVINNPAKKNVNL